MHTQPYPPWTERSDCRSPSTFSFETKVRFKVKFRVLFLCANNGVQRPMAEALLNGLDSKHFDAIRAGIDCGQVHPFTVEVM